MDRKVCAVEEPLRENMAPLKEFHCIFFPFKPYFYTLSYMLQKVLLVAIAQSKSCS